MLAVQMFQAKINSNTPVTLREIEKWFNGLDETMARGTRATAKGRSAQQRRLPAHPNNSNTSKANSATASEETTQDFSNYTCYNCNEKGHIASAFPKPRRNKSNNNNKTGSYARRSTNNNDRKAQSAKRGMARSRSAAATSNSTSTDGSVEHACMAHVVHAHAYSSRVHSTTVGPLRPTISSTTMIAPDHPSTSTSTNTASANSSTSPGFSRTEYARAARARDAPFDSPAERPSRRPHTDPPPLEEEDDNSLKEYFLEGITTFNIQVDKLFSDYKEDEIRNFL
jgi:hypothetical protein